MEKHIEVEYVFQEPKTGKEIELSTPDSKVKVWIIPTNEELAIARETVALV